MMKILQLNERFIMNKNKLRVENIDPENNLAIKQKIKNFKKDQII